MCVTKDFSNQVSVFIEVVVALVGRKRCLGCYGRVLGPSTSPSVIKQAVSLCTASCVLVTLVLLMVALMI